MMVVEERVAVEEGVAFQGGYGWFGGFLKVACLRMVSLWFFDHCDPGDCCNHCDHKRDQIEIRADDNAFLPL